MVTSYENPLSLIPQLSERHDLLREHVVKSFDMVKLGEVGAVRGRVHLVLPGMVNPKGPKPKAKP